MKLNDRRFFAVLVAGLLILNAGAIFHASAERPPQPPSPSPTLDPNETKPAKPKPVTRKKA